jgi:2-polyprenyl-6-methoxyphenol hydroxylase-like FAD-dependent oxidoreductase
VFANGLNGVPSTAAKTSRLGAGTILDDAPRFYEPGRIYMAVGKGGYVGLVRLEDGRLDVAAAFDAEFVKCCGGLAESAERVMKEAGFPELLAGRSSDVSCKLQSLARPANNTWKGTPALTRTPVQIAGPGWFAIGDAAGYVEPFTGEGMAWAISGAAAAVPFILRNDPEGWIREHRRIIGRRQRTCRGLARLLRRPGIYSWVVRGLNRFPGVARPIVRALNQPS